MLALLAPVLVFGLVIFVHELGHFLAAKAVGVYAPRFSIGFGRPIFKFRRGETEYILAWLPLGGYVRMASRHDAETAFLEGGSEEQSTRRADDPDYDPNAMIPFGPKPVPENRWFESKPLWARIVIMLAGVVMNAVLAVVVATALVSRQGRDIVPSTVIGSVHVPKSAPLLAQLQTGDTIRTINGEPVSTWNDVQRRIMESSDAIAITTQRTSLRLPLGPPDHLTPDSILDAITVYVAPVIDSVVAEFPAAKAGLQPGDSIVSIDGRPLRVWTDMVDQVGPSAGKPLTFAFARHGTLDTVTITPKAVEEADPETGHARSVGKIGAVPRTPVVHERVPFIRAIGYGVSVTMSDAGAVFRVLHDIGSGKQSVRQLGGPIAITRAAVSAAESGIDVLFRLIALLSINVAVLNLLPIPILDGGQILINMLESAKGSPFSMRTREYILRFGLFAIALLFAIVMYNDTRAGFVKVFGWIGRLFGA